MDRTPPSYAQTGAPDDSAVSAGVAERRLSVLDSKIGRSREECHATFRTETALYAKLVNEFVKEAETTRGLR